MTDRQYYFCEFQMGGASYFVIWYSGEEDGLLTNDERRLLSFGSSDQALAYASERALAIEPQEPAFYDLDRIESWFTGASADKIDCAELLDAWNMFLDVAASAGGASLFEAADARANDVYDKLFFGNNLPSITPPGEHYVPGWSAEEVGVLARIMRLGHRMVQAALSGHSGG